MAKNISYPVIIALIKKLSSGGGGTGDYLAKNNPTGTGYLSLNQRTNTTLGTKAVNLGHDTLASGDYSITAGVYSAASGLSAKAIGNGVIATGSFSSAENFNCVASGEGSHAEGYQTTASGNRGSHSEGYYTVASGEGSHAEGWGTEAKSSYQSVNGKYNIVDNINQYINIVGNGTSIAAKSNAYTLDWNGMGWFSSSVKVGGTGASDPNSYFLAKGFQKVYDTTADSHKYITPVPYSWYIFPSLISGLDIEMPGSYPANVENFEFKISFIADETASSFDFYNGIGAMFHGDDVEDGMFTPVPGKAYILHIFDSYLGPWVGEVISYTYQEP